MGESDKELVIFGSVYLIYWGNISGAEHWFQGTQFVMSTNFWISSGSPRAGSWKSVIAS
jgi:hypothetical protein